MFRFGIAVVKRDTINDNGEDIGVDHFIGYEDGPPTYEEYIHTYLELKENSDFGLNVDDYILIPASQDMIDHFNQVVKEQDPDFTIQLDEGD